jgi:cell division septum initiation protein DivIVA
LDHAAGNTPELTEAAQPATPSNGPVEAMPSFEPDDLPGALFGYDRYSTEKRLENLARRYAELLQKQAERDAKVHELERELIRRQKDERLIGETLVAAHRDAQMIRERARTEAQEVLGTARKRATKLLQEAEAEAESRARELVETAERQRKALVDEANRAKAFIEETHEQLSDFLLAAVKWYEQAKLSTGATQESAGDAPPPPARTSEG